MRVERLHQVVQDQIDDVFVEDAFVAERPQVELEGLRFDHLLVGHVGHLDGGKIWLACLGAQAGKLRDLHVDVVVALGLRIGKSL